MAEIHIGKSTIREDKRILVVYFHVPVTVENYPGGQVSAIADLLDQSEIDALAAGTLYEHITDFKKHESETKPEAVVRLKTKYSAEKTAIQQKLIEEYKFYSDTIEVT